MADIIETIRVPIRDRSIRVGPFVFGVVALDGIVQSTTLGVGCAWFSRVLTFQIDGWTPPLWMLADGGR